MSSRLVSLAVLIVVAVGAAGCEATIDTDTTEEYISQQADRYFGRTTSDVSCPSDTKYEEGKTFRCTVEYSDGTAQQVTVRMTGDDKVLVSEQDFDDQ